MIASESQYELEDQDLHVPITMSIQYSIQDIIRYQNRLVNKCLLHYSHREIGIVKHLELIKMVFLATKGDVI
jgi:hypothetical protein